MKIRDFLDWIWERIEKMSSMLPQQLWNITMLTSLVFSIGFNIYQSSQPLKIEQRKNREIIEIYKENKKEDIEREKEHEKDLKERIDEIKEKKRLLDSASSILDQTYKSLKVKK